MKTSMTLAQGWHANLWWVQYLRGGKRQAKREDNILINKVVLHRGKDEKKKVIETQVRQQVLREGIRGQTHWDHTHRKLVNLITLGPQPCLTQWIVSYSDDFSKFIRLCFITWFLLFFEMFCLPIGLFHLYWNSQAPCSQIFFQFLSCCSIWHIFGHLYRIF